MKTLALTLTILLTSTYSFATEYTVSKPITTVYAENFGKGKMKCQLRKNTKVESKWDNHKWSYIESKKPACKGWVLSKDLRS